MRGGEMKNEDEKKLIDALSGCATMFVAIFIFIVLMALLLSSCQKEPPTYCFECRNDIQTTTFCGYTLEEMNQVIEDWEGRQGDWKCNKILNDR
jgi:hypothetical protein